MRIGTRKVPCATRPLGRVCPEKQGIPCRVMPPAPSLAASLSSQQSALHTCPVVQASPSDLDKRQDSLCFPVAQSPAADWQFRQQLFFADKALFFTHATPVPPQAQNRTDFYIGGLIFGTSSNGNSVWCPFKW